MAIETKKWRENYVRDRNFHLKEKINYNRIKKVFSKNGKAKTYLKFENLDMEDLEHPGIYDFSGKSGIAKNKIGKCSTVNNFE